MNRMLGAMLLALPLWVPGAACEDARTTARTHAPLMAEALTVLRAERGRQMQAAARTVLAQLRSEAATALAQGGSTPAGPSVKTGP